MTPNGIITPHYKTYFVVPTHIFLQSTPIHQYLNPTPNPFAFVLVFTCMAISVSVQYNGGFPLDIILFSLSY